MTQSLVLITTENEIDNLDGAQILMSFLSTQENIGLKMNDDMRLHFGEIMAND